MKTKRNIPEGLMVIGKSTEPKYKPVLDFDGWRIAMLRKSEATTFASIHQVEKHNLTHEVFILTEGEADLIVCENGITPGEFFIQPMEKNVAYNILPGVWHHILVSTDAHVVIFEKSDTSRRNSEYYPLSQKEITYIKSLIRTEL